MKINLVFDDVHLDAIVHDLVNIASFMNKTSEYFDEAGMKSAENKLMQIRNDLLTAVEQVPDSPQTKA
jgi:hypothetical protein